MMGRVEVEVEVEVVGAGRSMKEKLCYRWKHRTGW